MTVMRVSRDEQKERTRESLIRAARKVFARRGFHRAGLDEIAAEAGFSTGAVYSNFGGKEDLFLAVLDEHIGQRLQAVERAVAEGTTPAAAVRAGADNWMRFLHDDPDWYPLFIEFWSYALRDPKLKAKVAERFAAFPEANAKLVAAGAREAGIPLPAAAARSTGLVLTALADGLALMKLLDPDAVHDELFGDAVAALIAR
jgi:AcrR family transcriptional regulator